MKKIAVLLLALLFVLTAMVGCGKKPGGVEDADESKKVTLRYYVWGEEKDNEALAEKFNKLHPNWTVEVELATGNYYDNLTTYFGADIAPDIFLMQSGQLMNYVRDGNLMNLSPYLEQSTKLTENDLWSANEGYKYDFSTDTIGVGDYYAYIKDFTPDFMMIYNKSHIDEYNQDKTAGQKLHEIIGYPTDEGSIYPSTQTPMTWAQCQKMCHELTKFNSNACYVWSRKRALYDN